MLFFSDTSVCMQLFADDVKLYSSFDSTSVDLQIVCDELVKWADKWQMRIAFNKCSAHRISNRESHFTVNPVYRIGGYLLDQSLLVYSAQCSCTCFFNTADFCF